METGQQTWQVCMAKQMYRKWVTFLVSLLSVSVIGLGRLSGFCWLFLLLLKGNQYILVCVCVCVCVCERERVREKRLTRGAGSVLLASTFPSSLALTECKRLKISVNVYQYTKRHKVKGVCK